MTKASGNIPTHDAKELFELLQKARKKRVKYTAKWRQAYKLKLAVENMLAIHMGQEPLSSVLADVILWLEEDIIRFKRMGTGASKRDPDFYKRISLVAKQKLSRQELSEHGRKGAIQKQLTATKRRLTREHVKRVISERANMGAHEGEEEAATGEDTAA